MPHSSYPVLVLFPSNLSSPDHLNNIYSSEALPVAVFTLHQYMVIVNLHNGPFLPRLHWDVLLFSSFCEYLHDLPRSADHVVYNFYLKIRHVVSPFLDFVCIGEYNNHKYANNIFTYFIYFMLLCYF
nr:MAG TPA: hypothetical protein [Caudoviricetes sp.]